MHPLIHALTVASGPGERTLDLQIFDRVPYRSRMILAAQRHELRMHATCPPGLIIDVRWRLQADDDGRATALEETVELRALALVAGFSIRASEQALAAMFAALEQRLRLS